MTSIFEGQPPKRRPFPIRTRVIWVPGSLVKYELRSSTVPRKTHLESIAPTGTGCYFTGWCMTEESKGMLRRGWHFDLMDTKSSQQVRYFPSMQILYSMRLCYIYIYRHTIYTHSMSMYIYICTHYDILYKCILRLRRKLDESGEGRRDGTVLGMFSCPRSQWSVTILGTFPEEFLEVYICWTEAHSYCLVHKFMTSSNLIRHIGIPPWLFLKMSSLLNPHFIQGMESFKAFRITIKIREWSMLISYAGNGFKQINISTPGIYTPIFPTYFWWLQKKTRTITLPVPVLTILTSPFLKGRALISEPQQVAPKVHQRGAKNGGVEGLDHQGPLVGWVIQGMKSYPVILGLFHKPL